MGQFESEWYSRVLRGANEPSLLPNTRSPTSDQIVRFAFLPSFEDQIVVRLNIPATGPIRLTAKRVTGDGGQRPYVISKTISKILSVPESTRIRKFISDARISQIAPKDCAAGDGLDGDTWIVENVEAGKYNHINRWMPRKGAVRAIGAELARLAGWERAVAEDR